MSKIVLNDVTNLNALSVINDNFDKLEQELQNKVLYRDNPEGEPNGLEGDLDANGNSIYNVQDLTITGSFSVNGKDIETVIDDAVQGIEDNAIAAENAATAAGISAASANTSATAAAASASTASTKASEASTSASNAASSATAAASSASTATTQAGIATTKASEASASASAAATSASSASTSASTATTQAGIATTQATNAASSASSAYTSATSAANSAAAAATALDSFDDRYLGSKSSDPTVDNDGNALLTGALYYNTVSQTMKVYDGANWITATAAGTTAMNVYKYVATAGQVTFSGAATVGGIMSYTSGNIIVFVNGVSLDSTDYTATNGTSVVLGSAASLNDEVVVVAFKSFTVADTYTQSAADAKFLDKTNITAGKVLGRDTSGSGAVQELPIAVTSGGNVGIGTSSPANPLTVVKANGGDYVAVFQNTTAGTPYNVWIKDATSPTAGYPLLSVSNSAGSTEYLRIDSSTGNVKINNGYGSAATAYGCRAWVNFNGSGTVAIRAGGNVSSITDLGIGNYTLNFTTALPDANYSVVGSSFQNVTGTAGPDTRTATTTSAVTVYTGNPGSFGDATTACFAIFR